MILKQAIPGLLITLSFFSNPIGGSAQEPQPAQGSHDISAVRAMGGSGVSPLSVTLGKVESIALDPANNLYIADAATHEIYKVDSNGKLTVIAGNGTPGYTGDNGPAIDASLNRPMGIAIDSNSNLYIADSNNMVVRAVDVHGVIRTIAGHFPKNTPTDIDQRYSGDGGPATAARLNFPVAVAIGPDGALYISDNLNQRVRRVDASGTISTIAGNGTSGYTGDNGRASDAELSSPDGICVDNKGDLFIADYGNSRIREVDALGQIRTIAEMNSPSGVAADGLGQVYIAASSSRRIEKIDVAGHVATIVGSGIEGFGGDGGDATKAELSWPTAVAVDRDGSVYIADRGNGRIRKVKSGEINTVAGNGILGFEGSRELHDECAADPGSYQACLQFAKQLSLTCSDLPQSELFCAPEVQCYEDRAIILQHLCEGVPLDSPACVASKARLASASADRCDKPISVPVPMAGPPPPIAVEWWTYPQIQLVFGSDMLWGGNDPIVHSAEAVCRANLYNRSTGQYLGLHPGKLVGRQCILSYGGWAVVAPQNFDYAWIPRQPGHWEGPHGDTPHMLLGGHDTDGSPLYVCRAHYYEQTSLALGLFPSVNDWGVQIGKLVNGQCNLELNGKEVTARNDLEVYYLTPAPTPPAGAPPSTAKPHPPQSEPTTTCQIQPHVAACGPAGVSPFQDNGCSVVCHDPGHPALCVPDTCADNSYTHELCVCRQ